MPRLIERTIAPTERDRKLASESSRLLDQLTEAPHDLCVQFMDEDAKPTELRLPAPAVQMLGQILKEMAKGNTLTLIPNDAMLSTQKAADILNVSRPFLVGLLEAGRIPYQRLGSHRRILFRDLLAFKAKTDAARDDAMRQLTEEAQELNMGY